WRGNNWNCRSATHNNFSMTDGSAPPWLIPLIIAIFVAVFVLIVLFMWLSSRGRFIFLDCVVKNRGAIVVPWREYRREGNSYFLFTLAVMFITIFIVAALALAILVPLGFFTANRHSFEMGALFVVSMILIGLL